METVSLNGRWQVKQNESPESDWLAAMVPGCVHTDLLEAGVIPDPFYRDNEQQVLWVGERDWVYRRTFQVGEALLEHDHVLLCCEGLDTVATISINGVFAGQSDNMFRIWEFDVRPFLRYGANEIMVQFASALRTGQEKLAERYIHSWSTDSHKLPGGNYVRKAQCHFGWDWGPQLVTCGIWRDISLVAYSVARLADVHIVQDHSRPDEVLLSCQVSIEKTAGTSLEVMCRVHFEGEEIDAQLLQVDGEPATVNLLIPNAKLWWPNGLGEQPLYTVSVTLIDETGRARDCLQKKIGLRTLRLVRQADEWGESFHFACNGHPFFAKGANWIPADSFITRVTDERYEQLLGAAADTHMNMLRVWGGGIYEQSIFYETCDELGICVWQDFMFACATYPTFDEAFMKNVEQEAQDNIRRLRHHACLALWCGNNELEQGLVGDSWTDSTMSWADYSKLFDDLLAKLVAELDPETDYWPGSPHTPHENRLHWNDSRWGDAHIWDVWHGMQPFEFYYSCFHRFNSEFGFQSFPEPQAVHGFAEAEDENITSYIMEYHQRNDSGNSKIMHYMLDWFRLPTSFGMTLWLSQILQGMAVKHAVEHWRRTMPRGMGTLYWQLNDCWPVASWSSLDYDGRWKALHYMAGHFYAPLIISAVADVERGEVQVHVTNDKREAAAGVVRWEVTTAEGHSVASGEETAVFAANQNSPVTTLMLGDALESQGGRNLLVWLSLEVDGLLVSENLALFARPKHLLLARPRIEWDVAAAGDGRYEITLSADKPALWVWLEAQDSDLQVSDNFFHMRGGQTQSLRLTVGSQEMELAAIKKGIKVYSLVDSYQN